MFERFTDTARRVVVLAQEEARMLHHNYVGTEHLLLALTGDSGSAGQALTKNGVNRTAVRGQITELIGEGITTSPGHIPFTTQSKLVLQGALRSALDYGVNYIDSGHILHSLLTGDTSAAPVAHVAITGSGASPDAISESLTELMTAPDAPEAGPQPRFVLSA
jgi:ATP-dependent Clp protease ATP-binding subunit ClpC